MTKLLERALKAARNLPSEAQDDIARIMLHLAGNEEAPAVALSAEERDGLAASKEAAARGAFASDEEVQAIWRKHGL